MQDIEVFRPFGLRSPQETTMTVFARYVSGFCTSSQYRSLNTSIALFLTLSRLPSLRLFYHDVFWRYNVLSYV